MNTNNRKWRGLVLASVGIAIVSMGVIFFNPTKDAPDHQLKMWKQQLSEVLTPLILVGKYPQGVELPLQGTFLMEYTIDENLQDAADKILDSYKPDYAAAVMIEANTGRILAMSSYQRDNPNAESLVFRNTFPAASIFKIITAAAAIDKYKFGPESIIAFNGANHTLYKNNAMNTKYNRWTRRITLREAFARSVNTAFARLSLEKMQPNDLNQYAERFGFNRGIASEVTMPMSATQIPDERSFALAEIASGFNRTTKLSPIHGAMIAAAVANDGLMLAPRFVDRVRDRDGMVVFENQIEPISRAISGETAAKMRELMQATISMGTSRKSFKPLMRNKKFNFLEVGGKTGSLTGTEPKGKVDWFVGYGISDKDRVAIATITVNKEKWRVKSSHVAKTLLEKYFRQEIEVLGADAAKVGKKRRL